MLRKVEMRMDHVMSIVWLVLMILFAITEAATMGLTAVWFAIGSLVALLATLFGAGLVVQLVLFVIVSAVFLYFTRPLAKRFFSGEKVKTNFDRIIGMYGVVTQAIDNEAAVGQVRVNGQVWTARSADGSLIAEGESVVVRSIAGVKLMVEKQAAPAVGI